MKKAVFTKQFKRDWKRLEKSSPANRRVSRIRESEAAIRLILKGNPFPEKWQVHTMKVKEFYDFLECHIQPDWLMIFKSEEDRVLFVRLGTHTDLF